MKLFEVKMMVAINTDNEKLVSGYYVAKNIKDVIDVLKINFEDNATEIISIITGVPVLAVLQ